MGTGDMFIPDSCLYCGEYEPGVLIDWCRKRRGDVINRLVDRGWCPKGYRGFDDILELFEPQARREDEKKPQ